MGIVTKIKRYSHPTEHYPSQLSGEREGYQYRAQRKDERHAGKI